MGRDGIVIGEPSGQLVAHRARGREVCAGEVVTAQRVNERFRHTVRLRTRDRSRDRYQVQALRCDDRIERGVDAPVVTQPLDRSVRPLAGAEACGNRPLHELLDIGGAEIPRRGDVGEHFTVVTIQGETYLDDLAVPACDLEHVAAPALIRNGALDQPPVRATSASPGGPRQGPAVQIHDALYALEVVRGLERPIDESADAACPI